MSFNRFLISYLFLILSVCCNGKCISWTTDEQEEIRYFFSLKSGNLLITNKQIMEIGPSKCKPILYPVSGFTDATVIKDTLVLLKNDTLFFIPSKNHFSKVARFLSIQKLFPTSPSFENVRIDGMHTIWLSGKFKGLYSITGGKLLNRLNVPVINEVKLSTDTTTWVGTNLGLYKYTEKLNSWQRYSEEALAGYDMPDNIVEHIYTDIEGCAWITMPAYISYLSKGNQEKEIPSFNYLGDAQTALLDVQLLKKGYLMATTKGLVYLSKVMPHLHEAGEEIHTNAHDNAGINISPGSLDLPSEFSNELIIHLGKNGKRIYLFTKKGYQTVMEKKYVPGMIPVFSPEMVFDEDSCAYAFN